MFEAGDILKCINNKYFSNPKLTIPGVELGKLYQLKKGLEDCYFLDDEGDELYPNRSEYYAGCFEAVPKGNAPPVLPAMTASPTGALRDNNGKVPLSWVPAIVWYAIATVLWKSSKSGGGKYPDHNWQKGALYSTPLDSLLRHALKRASGETHDPDSKLPHTWHILCNAAFLVFYEDKYPALDDLGDNRTKDDSK